MNFKFFKFLNKSRQKEILQILERKYGIRKRLNYLFIEKSLGKGFEVRIFSGLIDKESLNKLQYHARIESLGLGLCIIKGTEIKFYQDSIDFLVGNE